MTSSAVGTNVTNPMNNLPPSVAESVESSTLSICKCYDPKWESTLVPGEALKMIRAMAAEEQDKENLPIVTLSS